MSELPDRDALFAEAAEIVELVAGSLLPYHTRKRREKAVALRLFNLTAALTADAEVTEGPDNREAVEALILAARDVLRNCAAAHYGDCNERAALRAALEPFEATATK